MYYATPSVPHTHSRDVWPDDECFGSASASPEEELMMLRDIFLTDLGVVGK